MDGSWLRLYNIIFCYISKSVFILVVLSRNRAHGLMGSNLFKDASHLQSWQNVCRHQCQLQQQFSY